MNSPSSSLSALVGSLHWLAAHWFGSGSCYQALLSNVKFPFQGPGAETGEAGNRKKQHSFLGVFVQSGPFICFHNRFVFLIALLLSEIGPSIKTKQNKTNKQKQCRSWSGKDGGAFAGPIFYIWIFFFFFFMLYLFPRALIQYCA